MVRPTAIGLVYTPPQDNYMCAIPVMSAGE